MNKQLNNTRQSSSITKQNVRLAYIDTLRGFAACWVFLLHTHAYWLDNVRPTGVNSTRIITFLIACGGLGVDLFIVLSGFCLFYPLIRKSKELKDNFNIVNFYKRRAYRLLPAYYAALIFSTILALTLLRNNDPVTWIDILSYAFLVQTFSNETIGSINGSFWSIALEAQLYLLFPLLIFLYKRWRIWSVVSVAAIVSMLWQPTYHFISHSAGVAFDHNVHLPARWIEFVSGMVAALIISHHFEKSFKWSLGLFALTLPFSLVFITSFAQKVPAFVPHLVAGITFSSLVVLFAHLPEKIFTGKSPTGALTKLGEISYSFYLLHQPMLLLAAPFIKTLGLGILPTFALSFVTAIPVTALLAYIFYKYIESPFLVKGKKVQSQTTNQPVVSQPVPEGSS